MTDALITITPLGTDAEVVEWFRVVHAAYDGAETPEDFPAHLREQATAFDQEMVEQFLRALSDTGDPDGAIVAMLALEDQMPELYWAYQPGEYDAEDQTATDDPFGWVDDDQAAQLTAAWGGDWRQHLDAQLAPRWGADWVAHPADHKHAWFTDLLPELLAPQADPFDWVTEEQHTRLATAWVGDWQSHLETQLTARWGADWQSHPAEHKRAWFADLFPELLGSGDATESETVPADVAQEVSTLLDGYLTEELAGIGEDSELSEEELTELFAELRADLLDAPTPQEDRS